LRTPAKGEEYRKQIGLPKAGGKPNPGTKKDKRLKGNKGGKKKRGY
jgi:hypothetical protein